MKAQAGREGRSLSDYLVNIHKEHLGCLGNDKWDDRPEINVPENPMKTMVKEIVSSVVEKGISANWKDDFFNPQPKKGKK